jgi:pectinacetylesterase
VDYRTRLWSGILISSALLVAGCADGNGPNSNAPIAAESPSVSPPLAPESAPFQEIIDQGVTRYLGMYSPMLSEREGDTVNHSFGAGDGPLCIDGSEFTMATRDQGTDELLIFLQGGGACWPGLNACTESLDKGIPKIGVLDPDQANNPLASRSTVYIPYCDGGLHGSDKDHDSDADGRPDRFQRGLHNLSASLDVAVRTFPSPSRIVLAGSSAGGFGTITALPLVRQLYPDVPIVAINDSGLGILRPDEPEFARQRFEDWNLTAFIPASCETCIGEDGHITDYHKWQLEQDNNFTLGMMSYTRDAVISVTFTRAGGEVFEQELVPELEDLEAAFPTRVRSFVVDGSSHTFLLGSLETTSGTVTVADWVTAMLEGSAAWISTSD